MLGVSAQSIAQSPIPVNDVTQKLECLVTWDQGGKELTQRGTG